MQCNASKGREGREREREKERVYVEWLEWVRVLFMGLGPLTEAVLCNVTASENSSINSGGRC